MDKNIQINEMDLKHILQTLYPTINYSSKNQMDRRITYAP